MFHFGRNTKRHFESRDGKHANTFIAMRLNCVNKKFGGNGNIIAVHLHFLYDHVNKIYITKKKNYVVIQSR